jgi:hypothetical protein
MVLSGLFSRRAMKLKSLLLGLVVALASCMRPSGPLAVPLENDPSLVFPRFFDRTPVGVGKVGQAYELEGVLLQAIMIAAHHRFPKGSEGQPCLRRPEAHRYRVIRRENIIFVRIDSDPDFCGLDYVLSLDSGVTYAISTDGRILRRVFDGEPVELEPVSPPAPNPQQPWDGGVVPIHPEPQSEPSTAPDAGT